MPSIAIIDKIAFVGDDLPTPVRSRLRARRFAARRREPVASGPGGVPVDDSEGGFDYPAEVRFEIQEQEVASYRRAADFLNFANVDVVCLQLESGSTAARPARMTSCVARDQSVLTTGTADRAATPGCDRRPCRRRCQIRAAGRPHPHSRSSRIRPPGGRMRLPAPEFRNAPRLDSRSRLRCHPRARPRTRLLDTGSRRRAANRA